MEVFEALPIDLWCQIFGYLDYEDIINVCNVCTDFRRAAVLCKYPENEQVISSQSRYILNVGFYRILDNFSLNTLISNMFIMGYWLWDHEQDAMWNVEANLTNLFRNKSVVIQEVLDNFNIISECSEVVYEYPKDRVVPEGFSLVKNVKINLIKHDNFDYSEYPSFGNGRLNIFSLRSTERIDLSNSCSAVDISSSKGFTNAVKYLNLRGCTSLMSSELRYLKEVENLDLSRTEITEVNGLTNVRKLNVSHTRVREIHALENVKWLNLERTCVRDISTLRDVVWLNISNTPVETIPDLVNLEYLDVSKNYVGDLSVFKNFKNLKTLKMYDCMDVEDVTELGNLENLEYLDLSFTRVSDVSMLGNLKYLDISATYVEDVSMLGNVEHLNISDTLVSDVSALGNVKKLVMQNCNNVTDFSDLINVEELDLSGCNVGDVSIFKNVKILRLFGCEDIENLDMLPKSVIVKGSESNIIILEDLEEDLE